jgi:predicted metal-dependent hydrolase
MGMIVLLLEAPEAKARAGISDERIQEKLGWVKQYADDIAVWQECQKAVSASLKFINERYLFRGAAEELGRDIGNIIHHEKSKEVAKRLIENIRDCEQHLESDERLPMSTEILESLFGLYKQLERQHSKSGFTSLLACLPTLLKPITPESVQQAFARVSAKEVAKWIKANFNSTVTSRRQAAYQEHKSALKIATPQLTTT